MLRPQSLPLIARFGLGVAAAGAATLVTWLIPGSREDPYYSVFVLAVLVSSWWGGWTGGLVCTVLAITSTAFFLATPAGSFFVDSPQDLIRLGGFTVVSLFICAFNAAVRGRAMAREALLATEARYRLLFQDSPLPMWIFDRQTHRFLEVNEAAVEHYGYSREEFLRMTLEDIRPAEDRARLTAHLAEPQGKRLRHGDRWKHLRKDGTVIDVEISAHDLEWRGIPATLVLASDITARNQAERALRDSEVKFRALADTASCAIVVLQGDRLRYANRFASEATGYSIEELLTMMFFDIVHPDYREPMRQRGLARQRGEPVPSRYEAPVLTKQGHTLWLDVAATRIDYEGAPAGLLTAVDITDRKQAEEALKKSEEIYRQAIENASGVPFRLIFGSAPGEGYYDYVGGSIQNLIGLSPAEFTERKFREMATEVIPLLPEMPADPEECRQAMLRGELPQYKADVRVITATGEEKWLNDTSLPLRDEKTGRIVGALGILADITERKRAEQLQLAVYRIAEAASRSGSLDLLYAAVHRIIGEVMSARNFYIALYNEQKDLLSFPYFVDEVDAPPGPRKPGKELTSHVLRTGMPLLCTPEVDHELRTRGEVDLVGAPSPIWLGVPLRVEEKTIGVMVVQDYSNPTTYGEREQKILEYVSSQVATAIEHKRAEQILQESEARYRELVEHAAYGIYRYTVEGKLLDVNPALVAMLGYESKEALLGMDLSSEVYRYPSECAEIVQKIIQTGRFEVAEVEWKHKDGRPIRVHLSGRAVRDARRHLESIESIVENVTERRQLEDQLRQAQKMEAVGRLAGGVAHDFNNLLMVISGYAELLHDRFASDDVTTRNLDEILKASKRAAALTRQLLAFSRKQILEPKVLNLNDVVADVEKMLRRLIGEDVELVTRLGSRLGSVLADPGQVEQVLMNLVVNSRDAMPGGGRLVIETSNKTVQEDFAAQHLGLHTGEWVTMSVTDTGAGMDADTLAHIFEPFFTTKERGKGTGLGLATVYGIVKQSGGYISVSSEQGGGTTFAVYFPRVDEVAEPRATGVTVGITAGGKETVLVVEDEEGVRDVAVECLRAKGYTVLSAIDAGEALRLAGQHPGPLNLLLTDLVLPGMGGRDLAGQLSAQHPGIKVLYMSGYVSDAFHSKTELPPGTEFLQKPFSPSLLARKVREILDA